MHNGSGEASGSKIQGWLQAAGCVLQGCRLQGCRLQVAGRKGRKLAQCAQPQLQGRSQPDPKLQAADVRCKAARLQVAGCEGLSRELTAAALAQSRKRSMDAVWHSKILAPLVHQRFATSEKNLG